MDTLFLEKTNTEYIKTEIYPKVEKVLSTPEGSRTFINIIAKYINRNTSRLTTIGPIYLVPFTNTDKQEFYDLFNITEKEIIDVVNRLIKSINEKANWTLLKNNPIFILFYCTIRYYTIKKDNKSLNSALMITSLAFYPSMFTKYFKFEPNQGVMAYTIDNLSMKNIIKKESHMFGTLARSIQASWSFHQKQFLIGDDKDVIAFIQRIRNDQNSLMKNISQKYYENHSKGLTVSTTVDSYDDSIVVDNENNTTRVENVTNKIIMDMLVNNINMNFVSVAANGSQISKIQLRFYLTKILIDKNTTDIRNMIESILFLFLYDNNKKIEDIRSRDFISHALAVFKKTNAKNKNINNIKNTLDKWAETSGLNKDTSRLATRVSYTKGIFLYIILCIQKYS